MDPATRQRERGRRHALAVIPPSGTRNFNPSPSEPWLRTGSTFCQEAWVVRAEWVAVCDLHCYAQSNWKRRGGRGGTVVQAH